MKEQISPFVSFIFDLSIPNRFSHIHQFCSVNVNSAVDSIESKSMKTDSNNLNVQSDLTEMPPYKRFRIEEDPNCEAMYAYVTSKQLITQYHVQKLHSTFVPNVNGNWDDACETDESIKIETTIKSEEQESEKLTSDEPAIDEPAKLAAEQIDTAHDCLEDEADEILDFGPRITEASIGLYDRVVPLCNHINMDRLPKNLSDIEIKTDQSDEVDLHIFIANIRSNTDEANIQNEQSTGEFEKMSDGELNFE